jgi:hypothetical protein
VHPEVISTFNLVDINQTLKTKVRTGMVASLAMGLPSALTSSWRLRAIFLLLEFIHLTAERAIPFFHPLWPVFSQKGPHIFCWPCVLSYNNSSVSPLNDCTQVALFRVCVFPKHFNHTFLIVC